MFSSLVLGWTLIELLFYIYFRYTRQRFQVITQPKNPLSYESRMELYWNCLNTIHDVKTWGTGWFYYKHNKKHPPFEEIKRENLERWFAWAFWHDQLDKVKKTPEWATEINWMITNAEHWFQFKIPEGYNPSIECIRLTLDPVEAVHRPLIVYLVMYLTTHTFNVIFLRWVWGFQPGLTDSRFQWGLLGSLMSCSGRKISYWYRPSDQQVTPVVFIHGIGTGLLGYIEFLHQLLHMNRPVFFVELPYVSMRMVDSVPSARETVMEIRDMLKHHGYSKAVYVSHSLGTATTSWIMNLDPGIVSGSILIDPICFLLHYHHVAFNFVHRLPTRWIEYVVHYLASKEMYISHYISRHFHWFESIYFTQPMHGPLSNATVFLSENDIIVPSLDVYSYLSKHNINAVIMPQLQHAAFLINSKWKNTILNEIKCICIQADKKQVKKINNNKKREVL